ncbi:MAG: 50S ribosomal protein L15 [Actinobacteria bacterium]|jgi:large subunit ribosomal protein L15|nr:50S ribosomal protein L15 [Actinomycetota bacterium]
MKVHDLHAAPGSRRPKRRVARGTGGKGGKTAGRGTKGQGARNNIKPGFEGGQLPLTQRLPKLRGFNNPFRVSYRVVNLESLNAIDGDQVDPELLVRVGLARKGSLVKILGDGHVDRPMTVKAHGFSKSAKAAIEGAGGSTEDVPLPFKGSRPPARGNALTNR